MKNGQKNTQVNKINEDNIYIYNYLILYILSFYLYIIFIIF